MHTMIIPNNESFNDKDAKRAKLFLNLNLKGEAIPRKKLILNKLDKIENSNLNDLLTPEYANYKLDANTPGSNKITTPEIEKLYQKIILNDVKFSNLTPTDSSKTLDTPIIQFANSNIYKPPVNYLSPMNSIAFSPLSFENFAGISNLLSPNDNRTNSISTMNTIDTKANNSTTIDTTTIDTTTTDTATTDSATTDTTTTDTTTIDTTTKEIVNLDDFQVENKIIKQEESKLDSKIDKEIDADKLDDDQTELTKTIDLATSVDSQINVMKNQPVNQAFNNLSIHSNYSTSNIKNLNFIPNLSPTANRSITHLSNANNFYHSMNSNYTLNQNNYLINNHSNNFNSQLANHDNISNLINNSFNLTSRNGLNSPINTLTNSTNSADSQIVRIKRHSDEISDDKNDKKLKNREAAKRCRERKKQRVDQLEKQVQVLIHERDQLFKQAQYYEEQCRLLNNEFDNHRKNGCALNLNLDFNNNCQNFA